MSQKSPTPHHSFWGVVSSASELPNVAGAAVQDAAVEIGDRVFVQGVAGYVCIDPTVGAAEWSPFGANMGGEAIENIVGLNATIDEDGDVGTLFTYTIDQAPTNEWIGMRIDLDASSGNIGTVGNLYEIRADTGSGFAVISGINSDGNFFSTTTDGPDNPAFNIISSGGPSGGLFKDGGGTEYIGISDGSNALVHFNPDVGLSRADLPEWTQIGHVQTGDATTTVASSLTLQDDTAYWVQMEVVSRQSTTTANRGGWRRTALVYREAGGGATIEGQQLDFEVSSSVDLSAEFGVSGNDLRVEVSGIAGETVDWAVVMRYQPVN